jgi:Undecaprenyl-phosphate glucose phosphotransferase
VIIHAHNQKLNFWRFITDMVAIILSWFIAYAMRFEAGIIALPKGDAPFSLYFILTPVLALTYGLVFLGTGLYGRSLRRRRIWAEHFDIIRTHAVAFLCFVTLTYFVYDYRYSRVTLVLFLALCPLVVMVGRSVVRKINRRKLARSKPEHKAIIVGTGPTAERLAALVAENRSWNLEIIRCFSAENGNEVRDLLQKDKISVVFVSASTKETPHLQDIYDSLGNTVAEIIVVPDFGVPTLLSPKVTMIDTLPAVALNSSPLDSVGTLQKRLFDLFFSGAFLLFFSPLYLVCALLVRFSSPGPIFYKQDRMGLDGKVFQCLKFRGMRVDAETKSGPVWAKSDDDRTTPIGKILRKTSLDEIPQFINVLRGEMSIVGPRPERPFFVDQFRHKIPGYMLRHKSKAGITGWAQINGWRGNTSLEKRIECDLWYLQNWSIWLDIKICILTPLKGLVHPNAY